MILSKSCSKPDPEKLAVMKKRKSSKFCKVVKVVFRVNCAYFIVDSFADMFRCVNRFALCFKRTQILNGRKLKKMFAKI